MGLNPLSTQGALTLSSPSSLTLIWPFAEGGSGFVHFLDVYCGPSRHGHCAPQHGANGVVQWGLVGDLFSWRGGGV